MEPQENNREMSSINYVWLDRNYKPSHTHCHIPEHVNHEQNFCGNFTCCIVHDVYASAVLYMEVKLVQKPEFTFLALWKIFICITSVISIAYYWELENIAHNIIAFHWQTDSLYGCNMFQNKKWVTTTSAQLIVYSQ
jgi:hypothetical protein